MGEARKSSDVLLDTLARQRALLDGLFARVPEAIVLLDTDDRILQVNPEFTRVFGYSQEEACGRLITELLVPDELLAEIEEYPRRRLRGETLNVEAARKHKDGTRVHVSILSAPVSIAGSQICEYVIYRDITERKRSDERLRESEAYLAEAQRLSQTGSWAWNPATGDIRYWSEMCYRILGFDPTGPLPRFEEFFHRIHSDDQSASRQRFEQAIRDKADFELDYRIVHPEKGIRDIHAVGRAVLDACSNLIEFVGTVIDVTERKRAEQELLQSEADLRTKNDRLKLLLNVTNQITSSLGLRDLLRSISTNIRGVMQCDMVALTVPDGPSEGQRLLALDFPQGKGLIKEGLLLTPVGPGKRALESLKPTRISALEPDAFAPEVRELAIAEGLQRYCLIPLANRGRALGALVIARFGDASSSPDDLEFLAQVSGQIAIAVENALAFQEVSGLRDRLQLLLNLTNRVTSSLDLREVLRTVAASIREVIHADAAVVALPDSTSGKARIFAVDFPHGKGAIKEELCFTPSAPGKKAMETLKPVVWDSRGRDELAPEVSDIVAAEGIKSVCGIPLVNRGRALGLLSILRTTTDTPFTPEDVNFLSHASGQIAIAIENALAYHEISELRDKLAQEKLYLEDQIRSEMGFEQIIGNSPALKHVLQLVETAAPSDSTVLLLGETGTGKELIARAIHDRSHRKQRTLVKLNCAAIPTGLLESELFGHEKGAFTGAINQKIGRLELADQGTLFLDEVGDIPIEIQPKLLRVLQEREFERLGSTSTRKVNVRVVAATNRDLEKMVANREFRSDLYYRLNVFPIRIPPLRDRREDIPLLASYFVQKFAKEMQKRIDAVPAAAIKGLTAWDWPGNIRELENFIERAVLLTRGRSLEAPLTELQRTSKEGAPQTRPYELKQVAGETVDSRSEKRTVLNEYARKQRDEIMQALTECKGRVGGADGAATRLGMNRTTLLARMKKFGIYAKQFA